MQEEAVGGVASAWVNEIIALLGSMGLAATAEKDGRGTFRILVDGRDLHRAQALITEEYPEGIPPAPPPEPPRTETTWIGRGLGGMALIMGACALVFYSLREIGIEPTRADYLRHGVITWERVDQGEIWRLFTAVFVHFDGMHLASNMLTLLLVGPLLAHIIGGTRFVVVFALTGIGGNLASHFLSASGALKAGASGGVAGVLGVLAGISLRPGRQSRYRRWQVLAGIAAAYAMLVGTSPRSDDIAHAGGLLSGIALGFLQRTELPTRRT
jgi:membrane associated rhomboid family serine protease